MKDQAFTDSVIERLTSQIKNIPTDAVNETVGVITRLSDGIAEVSGLSRIQSSEMLEFPGGVFGVALNLEEDSVGAIILGDYLKLKEGDTVKSTGRILEIPVSDACGESTRRTAGRQGRNTCRHLQSY
jgi:F-type H+-transporting ATPase subunit alpha